MQTQHAKGVIQTIGQKIGPDVLTAMLNLYDQEQRQLIEQCPASAYDIPYGPHQRHRLDIYTPQNSSNTLLPVIVFIHGGGFLKGDKGDDKHWHNSNVGRMVAREGYLGVVINYRLAPESTWPSGGEDIASTIEWLKINIKEYGGDPDKLFLLGTSAGAVHISTYIQLLSKTGDIRAAILLSGLYGCTPLEERDAFYYGEDYLYPSRMPLTALTKTQLPLLLACAEFDPPRFQTEFIGLLQKRLTQHGHLPRSFILSGHNHLSMTIHLGTQDTRLSDEIFSFVEDNS